MLDLIFVLSVYVGIYYSSLIVGYTLGILVTHYRCTHDELMMYLLSTDQKLQYITRDPTDETGPFVASDLDLALKTPNTVVWDNGWYSNFGIGKPLEYAKSTNIERLNKHLGSISPICGTTSMDPDYVVYDSSSSSEPDMSSE
jgi:hypothetical protein